jgi:hypothetical protein
MDAQAEQELRVELWKCWVLCTPNCPCAECVEYMQKKLEGK